MLHSYGILQNNEDGQTAATRHSMDECDKHNVEHKKPHTKENILFGFLNMKFKKREAKLIYGIRSQNSGCPKAGGIIPGKGTRGTTGVLKLSVSYFER